MKSLAVMNDSCSLEKAKALLVSLGWLFYYILGPLTCSKTAHRAGLKLVPGRGSGAQQRPSACM